MFQTWGICSVSYCTR